MYSFSDAELERNAPSWWWMPSKKAAWRRAKTLHAQRQRQERWYDHAPLEELTEAGTEAVMSRYYTPTPPSLFYSPTLAEKRRELHAERAAEERRRDDNALATGIFVGSVYDSSSSSGGWSSSCSSDSSGGSCSSD